MVGKSGHVGCLVGWREGEEGGSWCVFHSVVKPRRDATLSMDVYYLLDHDIRALVKLGVVVDDVRAIALLKKYVEQVGQVARLPLPPGAAKRAAVASSRLNTGIGSKFKSPMLKEAAACVERQLEHNHP